MFSYNKVIRNLFIFLFSPSIIFVVYDIFFYYIPMLNNNYNYISFEYLYVMVFCDVFAIVTFIFLYLHYRHKINLNYTTFKNRPKSISILWYVFFVFCIFLLIHFLIVSVFGEIDYEEVLLNYAKFYALSKRGTAWVFLIINIFLFIMLYDLFREGYNKKKVFLFITALIIVSMTGGRSLIIIFLSFLLFIFIVVHRQKINIISLFVIVFLSLTIFIGNAILRATDIETYMSSKSHSLDFDNAFILDDSIQYFEAHDDSYLIFLVDIKNMFLPRKFFPDKPMSTAETRLVYPDVALYGTNYTFGIYANSLLNAGYFFVVFILLYILISNYLYIRYVIYNKKKNFGNFLIIFFLFNSIQFIRGGLFNSRLILIALSIVAAYLIYLLIPKKVNK